MPHYVIVGAGPAGFSAADVIRKRQPDAAITMVSDDPHGYYSRPGLAYVLTRELPESRIFPISRKGWERMRIQRIVGQVVHVDPAARQVTLADGHSLTCDALLLATGSASIPPPFPGGNLEGIVALDSLNDVRRILSLARHTRVAVVVGGGIIALELAEGLRVQGVEVHYFLRGERFWSAVLDVEESRLVESRLAHDGIQIHHRTEINRVLAQRDWRSRQKVAGVQTKDGRTVLCQMVAVAVGVRPRLELVAGTAIQVDRGILVNERMETSVPGIYAAGDVAQVLDPLTGQAQLDALWPVAIAQGRVAGANMAGVPTVYRRAVPVNVVRLTGLPVTILGTVGTSQEPDDDLLTISRGDSEVWRGIPGVLMIYDQKDVNRQRLVVKGNRLVGALLIGDQSLAPIVERLIEGQADVGPYLASIQAPHVNLAEVLRRIPG